MGGLFLRFLCQITKTVVLSVYGITLINVAIQTDRFVEHLESLKV